MIFLDTKLNGRLYFNVADASISKDNTGFMIRYMYIIYVYKFFV